MRTILLALALVSVSTAPAVHAALVTPEAATLVAGSEATVFGSVMSVTRLVDGSGLGGPEPQVHSGRELTNWTTLSAGAGGDYFAGTRPVPVIDFDLGADLVIDGIALWAYTFGSPSGLPQANSVRDFHLAFATDTAGPGGFGAPLVFLVAAAPPQRPSIAPRQDLAFAQAVTARYVRMTVTDNYFGVAGTEGGDRVGLGEVRFLASPLPVPAPAAAWLCVAGLLLGIGVRRR